MKTNITNGISFESVCLYSDKWFVQFTDYLNDYLISKLSCLNKLSHQVPYLSTDQIDKAIHKIGDNSASGYDNICIEHFKLAHPSVTVILQLILNIFITLGEVPIPFGLGIVTPIPKFKGNKRSVNSDDFRTITINVMASKIFEHSILSYFSNISTCDRQFGFKKGLSCSHAIHLIKKLC